MTLTAALDRMSLSQVAELCAQETQKFLAAKTYEAAYCFEIFRRAIVQKSDEAWTCIYDQYSGLVARWVSDHSEFERTGEESQYFVNQAFTNLARALQNPDKFQSFASLSAILAYLKACTHSAVRDEARKHTLPTVNLPEYVEMRSPLNVQQLVLGNEQRVALAELIRSRVKNEKEEVIVEAYFGMDLKPSEIFVKYSSIFDTQQEVYRVKQNLLERLRRDSELQDLWNE